MHVPDGFLDAPTSLATGVVAAAGVGGRPARGPRASSTTAPRRWPGWSRRSSSRPRCSTSRSAPAPAATCSAARWPRSSSGPGQRCSCMSDGPARAGAALRRRRAHRARHQHHPDGRGHRRASAGWSSRRLQALLPQAARARSRRRPRRGAGLGAGRRAGVRRSSTRVGGTADLPLDRLAAAMVGWHVLIGIGEARHHRARGRRVVAVRPDLVYGARPVLAARRELADRSPPRTAAGMSRDRPPTVVAPGSVLAASPCCSPAWSASSPPATPTA